METLKFWSSRKSTWHASIFLIMSGFAWGCASTLDITGILGVLISVAANAASNLETAGSMKLVWNAPATARRTWIGKKNENPFSRSFWILIYKGKRAVEMLKGLDLSFFFNRNGYPISTLLVAPLLFYSCSTILECNASCIQWFTLRSLNLHYMYDSSYVLLIVKLTVFRVHFVFNVW